MVKFPKVHPVATRYLTEIVRDTDARTMALIAGLSDEQLMGSKLRIVNPMLWEIGHIAWFHENFILRMVDGKQPVRPDADMLYDSMKVAHDTRWDLPLPDLQATRDYMEEIRDAVIARLGDDEMASVRDSYFTQLVVFHQDMHNEAFTYTRQTHGYPAPEIVSDIDLPPTEAGPHPGDVKVPGGVHMLGAQPTDPYFMDNEKWGHGFEVEPFSIARAPVTNAEFQAFVDDGGYKREDLWTPAGWGWRHHVDAEHPVYWSRTDDGWQVREYNRTVPLRPHAPVIHVNWFEADAWCRWAGRRLPHEAEWEVAASRAPDPGYDILRGPKSRYPWGDAPVEPRHANLDGRRNGTVDVAAYPDGDSAYGCRQMMGNVWEWTRTSFGRFEGFVPDPYADYSAPWMDGKHVVLRGGSWATRGRIVWNTFRNFYTCDRNDVIAGFRTCAL
jgi:iron(II)-dependent oxidoreductase